MTTADAGPATAAAASGGDAADRAAPAAWKDAGVLQELRSARAAGRLASDFPALSRLLARLPDQDLPRAGQILARTDPAAVTAAHPDVPVVTALITGHSTVAPLVAPLTAELARHGLLLAPVVSEYDSYVRDLLDPTSRVYADPPQLTLCLLDPYVVLDELPSPWRVDDVEAALRSRLDVLRTAARTHHEAGGTGLLVLNTVPLLRHLTHQVLDHRSRARLGAAWREFNAGLLGLAVDHPGVCVIDADPLLAQGSPACEPRTALYAKARLSDELLAGYAREVGALARHRAGRTKKVLVLDLDGTVWGGILGEDGPQGIQVGGTLRGEAFQEFQRVAKQLSSQGVLLAVSSKNDAEPVLEALRDHPEMVLRDTDFVRVNANWSAKHDNLRDIAERLNLGLDSFVFVDDSPFECGLVRDQLPEVAVVAVDDEPAFHPVALLSDGWFDVLDVTEEDRARAERYRTEVRREDFRQDFASYQDYLDGLGITVTVAPPQPSELARIAQLTLRTNQFNLTTRRLQLPDLETWLAEPGHEALAVRTADRFGEHGLVGALFLDRGGDTVRIDNFVLSCRVFSRGIETGCLSAVLAHAGASGAREVTGSYRPTRKNAAFRGFYSDLGFVPVSETDEETVHRHDLRDVPAVPAHLTMDTWFEEKRI